MLRLTLRSSLRLLSAILLLSTLTTQAETKNGFDLTDSLVPPVDIHQGGPPKNGIPAIDSPNFVAAEKADFLEPKSLVLGLHYKGIAKAYPIHILNYHEVVNDQFEQAAITVTYCPLCASGVAYLLPKSLAKGGFAVSGLLYNSDVLLYDRATESLWSQMLSQAVSGTLRGTQLERIPLQHTTWKSWLRDHPKTIVLSEHTGFKRNYDRDPYKGYENSDGIWFPVDHRDPRFHPKERVIAITRNQINKVYPFAEISKMTSPFLDKIGDEEIIVYYDALANSASLYDKQRNLLPAISSYWFAWIAFNPESDVFYARKLANR